MKRLQGKLLRRQSQLDSSRLTLSPEASSRMSGTLLILTANQVIVMSPVAKKPSIEKPLGIRTLQKVSVTV